MSDNNQELENNPKSLLHWPKQLNSVSDINLFEEVINTLKAADNKNVIPSSLPYFGSNLVTPTAPPRAKSMSSDIGIYSPLLHNCAKSS